MPLGNPHFRASTLIDHLREFVQFQDEVVASREERGSSRKSGEAAPNMPIEAVDEKASVGSAEKSSTNIKKLERGGEKPIYIDENMRWVLLAF